MNGKTDEKQALLRNTEQLDTGRWGPMESPRRIITNRESPILMLGRRSRRYRNTAPAGICRTLFSDEYDRSQTLTREQDTLNRVQWYRGREQTLLPEEAAWRSSAERELLRIRNSRSESSREEEGHRDNERSNRRRSIRSRRVE